MSTTQDSNGLYMTAISNIRFWRFDGLSHPITAGRSLPRSGMPCHNHDLGLHEPSRPVDTSAHQRSRFSSLVQNCPLRPQHRPENQQQTMPVTFGSFGDIVSLGIIIKDLVECLNNRRGSSAEYQAVVRELSSLDDALSHVKSPCKCSEQSADLSMTANNCAKECQSCTERFWEQIKIYRTCLKDGGSRSAFKDTASKVRWQVSERKRLATFRAEINGHCSSINMLLGTVNM